MTTDHDQTVQEMKDWIDAAVKRHEGDKPDRPEIVGYVTYRSQRIPVMGLRADPDRLSAHPDHRPAMEVRIMLGRNEYATDGDYLLIFGDTGESAGEISAESFRRLVFWHEPIAAAMAIAQHWIASDKLAMLGSAVELAA